MTADAQPMDLAMVIWGGLFLALIVADWLHERWKGRHATTSEQSAAAVEGLAPREQPGRDDRHGLRDGVGGASDQTVTVAEVYFEEESAPDSWTAFRDPRLDRINRYSSKRVN